MKTIDKKQADRLIYENRDNLYVIVLNDSIFQTLGVAAYIGFKMDQLKDFFESLRDAFPVDVTGYSISLISDVKKIEDFRGLFLDENNRLNECDKIFIANYGIVQRGDIFSFDDNKINKAVELLSDKKDTDHFYTLTDKCGNIYFENGRQIIFFDIEDAYSKHFKIDDSRVLDLGEIVMPFFYKNFISDFVKVAVKDIELSGRELNEVFRKHFEESCLSISQILDILTDSVYIYYSSDGSNLILQHYSQTLFFTSINKINRFDTDAMPLNSDPIRIDNKYMYSDIITSEYVFFDGERHCKVQDFYRAAK